MSHVQNHCSTGIAMQSDAISMDERFAIDSPRSGLGQQKHLRHRGKYLLAREIITIL